MANIYLSNQPAGTYGGIAWGVGSDANNGESPASPKLTANSALDLYATSANDGGTLFINDGDYTYSNGDGRWILNHASCTITPMNDYLTSITFSGSQDQGFRYNFSSGEVKSCFIGKINIKVSANKLFGFYSSGSNSGLLQSDVECQARFVPNNEGTASSATRYGFYDLTGSGTVKLSGGGVSAADGSLIDLSGEAYIYQPYFQVNATAYNPSVPAHFIVTSWAFNVKMNGSDERGLLHVTNAAAYPAGSSIKISGVTGEVYLSNSNDNMQYFVKLVNQPNGSIVENNNITITALGGAGVSGIGILGADADSLNNIIRYNTLNLTTGSGLGLGIVVGAEGGGGGAYERTYGDVYGNNVNYSNTAGTNVVHGINHIYGEGSRYENVISGVSIGSLTKASSASSYNNIISVDPLSVSKVYLYAKGSYSNASFYNETLISSPSYSGSFIQSLVDDTTGGSDVYSDNPFFYNISIAGDVSSSANIFSVGLGASDTSTATLIDVEIPNTWDALSVYGKQGTNSYTTLGQVNALSFVNNVFDGDVAVKSNIYINPQTQAATSSSFTLQPSQELQVFAAPDLEENEYVTIEVNDAIQGWRTMGVVVNQFDSNGFIVNNKRVAQEYRLTKSVTRLATRIESN